MHPTTELVLAGRDSLYFYGEPDRKATVGDGGATGGPWPHDLDYLALYQRFQREADAGRKLALYEQLAAWTTAPLGAPWPEDMLALTFEDGPATQESIEAGLRFWVNLVSDA